MNILCVMYVYNEIDLIDQKIGWCKKNGIKTAIIDNMSDDGTFEYCKENCDYVRRVDTNGAFDLMVLLDECSKVVSEIKPDWILLQSPDSYLATSKNIVDLIKETDISGFKYITSKYYMLVSESHAYKPQGDKFICMSAKYYDGFKFYPDKLCANSIHQEFSIKGEERRLRESEGLFLNWGMSRSVEQRERTYKRRKKAWDNGLPSNMGRHYTKARSKNWDFSSFELYDMSDRDIFKTLKSEIQK